MTEEEGVQFSPEQQALVDKLVGDARIKAREKAQTDAMAQAAKDKDAAEQASLAAKQQWQALAEQHKARVDELEPLVKQIEGYEELVTGLLEDTIEELGDAAKTAIDGLPTGMTAIDKLNWLHKNEGLFQPTGGGVGTPGRLTKPLANVKDEPRRIVSL